MTASNRILKTRTAISSTVENELWKNFQQLSKDTRINASKLLDEALQDLLEKYQKRK